MDATAANPIVRVEYLNQDDGERHRFIALPYGVSPDTPEWTSYLIAQGIHRKLSAFMRQLVVGCDVYRLDVGEWKRVA